MSTVEDTPQYHKKDFMSDQTVRWCPGCGDYAILSQVQTVFADLGIPRHQFAVVSGIGCSSRFPYYMNTYGFHTIHGRAPAFATGLRLANPELSVWLVTGDGDGLSIGGNHLIHILRRNVDLQILMFNNRIYGLTKGQYSPTSEVGKRTKSSPMGSIDRPFMPCALAIGADGTFIARTADIFVKEQRALLKAAHRHKGTSFIEILQNCVIFNGGAFDDQTARKLRDEHCVFLENGKPMLYGSKDARKGLVIGDDYRIGSIDIHTPEDEARVLVHHQTNLAMATLLTRIGTDDGLPTAMGIMYHMQAPVYEREVYAQIETAQARPGSGNLHKALVGKNPWTVQG
ncbi:MAG: 2-oxoacid:ferredoxin oxidoreductase subunit beta [Oligoflexia bacterium]|nr:2-oxoacid:ferredoxin oxidoreductase subunit beta [Oligoflexia bacterium]